MWTPKNMDGPDYHMALLLQRQIDQENSHKTDFHLALKLQDDFNKELSTENPVGLIYDQKNKTGQDTRCLVDPSWELIDPTPNIYNLFVAFNQRFFWNKLLAVCVSWSKRMTSCAGICSYQGRGGMCSITLSEPLLKLRPRKDLVETLLHEMIHAYLFVTHNNRDRDGHGPEFLKHMFRINKEAGTNITVYHNFHDEVRLYQQHWWRCNGPCQNRKPYFGMVRRATNRAPGPNDRWWNEHTYSCGGIFIKVREPEKKVKTQKDKPIFNTASTSDIRTFLPVISKINSINSSSDNSNQVSQRVNTNVHGINNYSNSTQNNSKVCQVSDVGNVHGFANYSTPQKSVNDTVSKASVKSIFNNVGNQKTKHNSNSTIVINKKSNSDKKKTTAVVASNIDVFSGTGKRLISPEKVDSKCDKDDYSVVRNHWVNKFPLTASTVGERNSIDSSLLNSKKQKIEKVNDVHSVMSVTLSSDDMNDDLLVPCPVCQKQMKESLLNDHLDFCLQEQDKINVETKQLCFICNKEITMKDYQCHINSCSDYNLADNELVECEICNLYFNKEKIETHRKSCIENIFATSTQSSPETFKTQVDSTVTELSQCPVCDNFIESTELNIHKEKCLLKVFKDIDKKYDLNSCDEEEIRCLVCNKKLRKSELNAHLDDCMGDVFADKNDFNFPSKSDSNINDNHTHNCDKNNIQNKFNCPFCMELYSELDMSGHLDQCLISDEDNCDKTILIDSFSSDNSF